MNAKIKADWLAALRSGKYAQDYNYLRTEKGFCCLGVLTDLYCQGKGEEWKFHSGPDYLGINHFRTESGAFVFPSNSVLSWAGFANNSQIPVLIDREGYQCTLSQLNDSGEFTFSQIADIVEYFL